MEPTWLFFIGLAVLVLVAWFALKVVHYLAGLDQAVHDERETFEE